MCKSGAGRPNRRCSGLRAARGYKCATVSKAAGPLLLGSVRGAGQAAVGRRAARQRPAVRARLASGAAGLLRRARSEERPTRMRPKEAGARNRQRDDVCVKTKRYRRRQAQLGCNQKAAAAARPRGTAGMPAGPRRVAAAAPAAGGAAGRPLEPPRAARRSGRAPRGRPRRRAPPHAAGASSALASSAPCCPPNAAAITRRVPNALWRRMRVGSALSSSSAPFAI